MAPDSLRSVLRGRSDSVDSPSGVPYYPFTVLTYPDIDPVIFRLGPLSVRWYGLMYLVGFTAGYFIIKNRLLKTEAAFKREQIESLVLWAIVGLIVGARLGEILFYHWPEWRVYVHNPLEIIAIWKGGMSFHGGLIGAVILGVYYLRRQKLPVLPAADAVFLAVPIGLAAGRLGNFINGELFGRVTDLPWGMIFPLGGSLPRHPSQLYEMILEGPLLFAFLWLRRDRVHPGGLTALFVIGYAVLRFVVEFVREPDPQLGFVVGFLTMGQLLSLVQVGVGVLIWRWTKSRWERTT